MTSNLILAAGHASRWDGPGLKQMLDIDGVPLIARTARMLDDPTIVTVHDELMALGFRFLVPADSSGTCRTVLSTRSVWKERVNIWLGDVFYTDMTRLLVENCKEPIMFFGDGHDIFAMSFSDHARAIEAFETASKLGANECRLWEAYRALFGLDVWPLKMAYRCYTMIYDETTDFDTLEKYESWKALRTA